MTHEEMIAVLEDYIKTQTSEWGNPSWYDCLFFLGGYFGCINADMVLTVRKMQREGKVE